MVARQKPLSEHMGEGWRNARNGFRYEHAGGGAVERERNEKSGLIEWKAESNGKTTWHGQNLHSAMGAATS